MGLFGCFSSQRSSPSSMMHSASSTDSLLPGGPEKKERSSLRHRLWGRIQRICSVFSQPETLLCIGMGLLTVGALAACVGTAFAPSFGFIPGLTCMLVGGVFILGSCVCEAMRSYRCHKAPNSKETMPSEDKRSNIKTRRGTMTENPSFGREMMNVTSENFE